MNRKKMYAAVVCLIVWGILSFAAQSGETAQYKVLVVMSYEEKFPWCQEIKEGIEQVLSKDSEIRYFYMDTKTNIAGGPQKAKEAYALYEEFQPDGVIAADDNAQAMFVVPYLKEKVGTPVMFCGVNAEPEKYGYPASHISGMLERLHIKETLALLKLLAPSVETIGFITKESPTAKASVQQVERESETYPIESFEAAMVKTLEEAITKTKEFKQDRDALFLLPSLEGLPDKNGRPLTEKEVVPILTKTFGKLTAGPYFLVKYGLLCAVQHTGQEQGGTAAEMLLKAMQGTPVSDIPITQNYKGKRLINIEVLKELGITPKPAVLRGAELVKTEK